MNVQAHDCSECDATDPAENNRYSEAACALGIKLANSEMVGVRLRYLSFEAFCSQAYLHVLTIDDVRQSRGRHYESRKSTALVLQVPLAFRLIMWTKYAFTYIHLRFAYFAR